MQKGQTISLKAHPMKPSLKKPVIDKVSEPLKAHPMEPNLQKTFTDKVSKSLKAYPIKPNLEKSVINKVSGTEFDIKNQQPEAAAETPWFDSKTTPFDTGIHQLETNVNQSDSGKQGAPALESPILGTADVHMKFLELSSHNMEAFEKQFAMLTRMASFCLNGSHDFDQPQDHEHISETSLSRITPPGSAGKKTEEKKSGKKPPL